MKNPRTSKGANSANAILWSEGHTKILLLDLCCYYYATVGSKRHQRHRRTRGGIRRDTKGTGGHTRTGGHSGGIGSRERHQAPRGPERENSGIGAGRKATRITHWYGVLLYKKSYVANVPFVTANFPK